MGAEAAGLGERILLICTPSLEHSATTSQLREQLGNRLTAEFTGVAPHVPTDSVEVARALANRHQIDVVIAIGGGSAMGVGKGIAAASHMPLIAIPTTYAGSEMTPVFGSRDPAKGVKQVRRDPAALPRLAIYDPELFVDLPPAITASTGMNALAHCVEACYARGANPVVVAAALEGVRHIVRALPECVAEGSDLDAREDLLAGSYLAAFSIANATMGLHHGLCHVLGGRTGAPHGELNSIMLAHVARFNADAVPDAMEQIAEALDAGARTRDTGAAPRFIAAFAESLPVPRRLRDVGVGHETLDSIAVEAAANATVRANPKPAGAHEIRELLQAAW